MRITPYPSPNFSARTQDPDMIIIHYTDMPTAESALERLCDPQAKVSAHYLIAKTGEIYKLVPEDKAAHHAGISHWRGRDSLNQYSIGIELDNPGHAAGKLKPFPDVQMESLMELIRDIRTRHKIHDWNIIGHSDVAPDRKKDPGELFGWQRLARRDIGLWPESGSIWEWGQWALLGMCMIGIWNENHCPDSFGKRVRRPKDVMEAQKLLRTIGYKVPTTGKAEEETEFAILAFQRHFCTESLGKGLDSRTREMLTRVAKTFRG
jgi:N-acetylmuramoyl-L-alanine amidase